ncbi:MAG: TIM-barrel domain-containing protein [Parabacteroides sp.]
MMRRFCCWLLCFFSLQLAFAGNRKEVFDVKLQNGLKMCVEVCEDGIFHIQMTPHDQYTESLLQRYQILKTDWAAVEVKKKEDRQKFELRTAHYILKVNKQTGLVSVTNNEGKNIIEQLRFYASSDRLCEKLGEVINKKFLDLNVSNNSGIIGDDKKPTLKDMAETGDFKNNSILSVLLKNDERFYGGGSTSREHIQHRGELLRMWATYQHTEIPTPFMISSNNWGIFNNTTRKNFFDVGSYDHDNLYVYNTTDEADFYLMFGNSMCDVIDKYTTITGKPFLFPKWAYGLNFGPNMLEGQFDILNDAVRFRELGVPCDMFWLEPQWMEKRYDFSTKKKWNYQKFTAEPYWVADKYPKSESHNLLIGRLHGLGFHLCLWLCEEYDESLVAEDELAAQAGKSQSGQEHWMDHLMNFVDNGVDGFKLDPARTIDEHPDFSYYNGRTDKEMHNLNQVLMPKQLFTTSRYHKGTRAFQHYTAGWAGTQHWTASTSGDNGGGKTALFDQLNLGISGFLNTSCDVLNVGKDQEMQSLHFGLFLPWVQINSWYSLHQPFYFPEKEKNIYRDYVKLRYSLMPYIYSAALEGAQSGMPIVRAMPLMFPDDRHVDDMVYQYMFGENLLVGIFSDSIYLPKGNWIDYWTGEVIAGGQEIKHAIPDNRAGLLFVREGAIIPYQKDMQYIGEKSLDTLIVRVYPKKFSSYALYEDDGRSFDYEQGKVAVTRFECRENNRNVEFTIFPVKGDYKGMYRARTYELEIACLRRPSMVRINNVIQEGWRYGDDHKLYLTLHQKEVSEKVVVSIL